MFLKNVFLKTLRDYRLSVLIWGGGLALVAVALAQSYNSLFTGPDRARLIADYQKTVEAFSTLTGKATDLDTFGGFISYQIARVVILVVPLFSFLAGSAIIRGEEEKGSLDLLLSTPHSRRAVLLQKWAGLVVIIGAICGLCWLGLIAGAATVPSVSLDAGATGLECLNVGLYGLFFGSLALALSQLMSRKTAMGLSGGLFVGSFLLNNLLANVPALAWLRYGLPAYYEGLSRPLARSVGINPVGFTVTAVGSLVATGLALLMYEVRDHNSVFRLGRPAPVVAPRQARSVERLPSVWLLNPFTFGLRSTLSGTGWWTLGIGAYSILVLSVINDLRSSLVSLLQSDLYRSLGFSALATNESLLSAVLFIFAILLFAAFAVMAVAGWSSEETDGRLELLLSTPISRPRLLLSRLGVSLTSTTLLVGLTGLIFVVGGGLVGVSVDGGKTFAAFFGLWVLCVIIEAAGFLLTAFGPGRAVAILGGLVVVSYLIDLLANLLKFPDWLVNLSVFHQYGRPLISGLDLLPQLIMLGLSILMIGLAVVRFDRRDLNH